jgi:hypothetical protein
METFDIIQDAILICKDQKAIFLNRRAKSMFESVKVDEAILFEFENVETKEKKGYTLG